MKERCHSIPIVSSFIAMAAGVLVVIGWVFSPAFLKNVSLFTMPMSFISAVSFIMSGLILFSIDKIIHADHKSADIAPIFLSAASLIILLLFSFFLVFKFLGIAFDIEKISVGKTAAQIFLAKEPSMATVFNFILISIVGIAAMFKPKCFQPMIFISGIIIGFIGLIGIIGHVLNVPFLYFDIKGISSLISADSVLLFVLIGFAFSLLGMCHKNLRDLFSMVIRSKK